MKHYTCSNCHGTVQANGRKQDIEEVRAVHEATCPSTLRLAGKTKKK